MGLDGGGPRPHNRKVQKKIREVCATTPYTITGVQVCYHGRNLLLIPTRTGWCASGIAEGELDDEGYPGDDTACEGEGVSPDDALAACLKEILEIEMSEDDDTGDDESSE